MTSKLIIKFLVACSLALLLTVPGQAQKKDKLNILVIWGDDIGWYNPGIYNRGIMGYKTPNIDKIGQEGIMFTDYYAQQSCTAGRAAFIHRTVAISYRSYQGGFARSKGGYERIGSHYRWSFKKSWICHWSIR